MGYYAPSEFYRPSQGSISIEKVEFFAENATFFNVTVLNPSYSTSNVRVEQISVVTNDGLLFKASNPSLPLRMAPGSVHIFKAFWNWGNYTGQTVDVIVLVSDGSGATFKASLPSVRLRIVSVNFYPDASVTYFNVTVNTLLSTTFVDISALKVNGVESSVSTLLPVRLVPNASVTFKVNRDWTDLQGTPVTVTVSTLQGFEVSTTVTAPSVVLSVISLVFNTTDTLHFNITIHNDATSAAKVDISAVTVYVLGESIVISEVSPSLSPPIPLQPDSDVLLTCSWDWSARHGQDVRVTIQTLQGFIVSAEVTTP
jgi:hypothetical protein